MSLVTNVVLLMPRTEAMDADTEYGHDIAGLNAINSWLAAHQMGKLHPVDQYGTNRKAMECHVAVGAFNYLDLAGLEKAFREAPWQEPQRVQLLIMEQEEHQFRLCQSAHTPRAFIHDDGKAERIEHVLHFTPALAKDPRGAQFIGEQVAEILASGKSAFVKVARPAEEERQH